MGRKAKYSKEQKIQASIDYLTGSKSAKTISLELNMGKRGKLHVYKWAKRYQIHGESAFDQGKSNRQYSKEFKEKLVQEYLEGKGSITDLLVKYNLPSDSILRSWIKKYNSHIGLKDYDPKPEVYMANTLKTTFEEVYWKCPDLIIHIELNLRNIYFKKQNNTCCGCRRGGKSNSLCFNKIKG